MLELIDLTFDYQEEPLLNKIGLQVSAGDLVHLRGANGSGKTTLLKLIAGLYQPHEGEIRFLGQTINKNLAVYQRQLCFVGHKTGINPYLTLLENCRFDTHYDNRDLQQLAAVFDLQKYSHKMTGLLSAGQRRQVGLLRLWMTKAVLWLLDEPLVALDEKAIVVLMNRIKEHRQQGGAVILSSHQSLPLPSNEYQEYLL
ncbi:MAG: cytochrome c biogenesis heme-transporting ATPase CcmA [Legionella sp.]|jgi:heme exporter protein A